MKKYIGKFFIVVFALLLFAVTQYISDFSVGAWDWFFKNLPLSLSVADYPVASILTSPLMDFIVSWAPVVCLALSILLFMDKKNLWGFLLITAPLVPALISSMIFYNAAQIHVAPGENLFASGVLAGKKTSYALQQEQQENVNAD